MRPEHLLQGSRIVFCFLVFFAPSANAADEQARTQTLITPNASGGATPSTQIIVPNAAPAASNPSATLGSINAPTTSNSIPTPQPSSTAPPITYGRFRNKDGTTKVAEMLLDRFKESVVKITVRDNAGNALSKAMGVSIGKEKSYIATTLSLLLGNVVQWGDKIEIMHYAGNSYEATIALVDEQMDLVLLNPEIMPPSIPFVSVDNERSGIAIFTLGLDKQVANPIEENATPLEPKIFKGSLAAANATSGSLSVSKNVIENAYSGTAIINTQGELLGMLLPNGKGVLSSYLKQAAQKAIVSNHPLPIRMLGAIMGRGVLVDPSLPEAFKSIGEALAAIKSGKAPKPNTTLFNAAKTNDLAPKKSSRVILKVMPGVYREKDPIILPEQISFTGSGPKETVLMQQNPNTPVIKVENTRAVSITGFRIVPAALQASAAATVLINRSADIILLGNVIEAKGGSAVEIQRSSSIQILGNTFPKGKNRAITCKESTQHIEANAFLGDWPQALSIDIGCNSEITRNLFIETKMGIALSGQAQFVTIQKNSFLRSIAGIRFFGNPMPADINDNLFSQGVYSFYSTASLDPKKLGRNHVWKNIAEAKGKQLRTLDVVRIEPAFENVEVYDFRPKLRNPGAGSGSENTELGLSDLGAYQRTDFLGKYTSYFISTLQVATGVDGIAEAWGYK